MVGILAAPSSALETARLTPAINHQDALSSVAVVGQLLGQAISIWQQIDMVRQTVKAAPKLRKDLTAQSINLQRILRDIKTSTYLHTHTIHIQIKHILSISLELHDILEDLAILNRKTFLRQGLYVLGHKARDESKLNDVLSRIEKAKLDLLLKMQLVQLEMTGDISEEIRGSASDTQKDNPDVSPMVTMDGNRTRGKADQNNGVVGLEHLRTQVTASITDNTALDQSRQNNLILCGPDSTLR